ncbi:MAG: hypothetical protein IID61_01730 [SAR324 cluster bacterium]|nr:hypothetical protein [SAR324 cluster bacterium]
MNRTSLVGILVTATVFAGLLFLFPAQWVALLAAIVALVTGQVILVRRHITVLPAPSRRVASSRGGEPLDGASPAALRGTPAPPEPPEPESVPATETVDPHDKELYSRFRAHLEKFEQSAADSGADGDAAAKAPPPESDADGSDALADQTEDKIEISAAAKAGGKFPASKFPAMSQRPTVASGDTKAVAEDGEDRDLFADLRPGMAGADAAETPSAQNPEPRGHQAPAKSAAPPLDEVQAALEHARSPENLRQEGAALLKLAQDAHDAGERKGLEAALEQFGALLEDAPELMDWRAAWLRARLAVMQDRLEDVPIAFEEMLRRKGEPPESDVPEVLHEMLAGVPREAEPATRVALLHKILSAYRQSGKREAMDRIYSLIEEVQESTGDERKLIRLYKNHLTIREALGNREGQLELIDKIGKRYFKLGDTAPAKEYYEMGLKLRAQLQAESGEGKIAGDGAAVDSGEKAPAADSVEPAAADSAPPDSAPPNSAEPAAADTTDEIAPDSDAPPPEAPGESKPHPAKKG